MFTLEVRENPLPGFSQQASPAWYVLDQKRGRASPAGLRYEPPPEARAPYSTDGRSWDTDEGGAAAGVRGGSDGVRAARGGPSKRESAPRRADPGADVSGARGGRSPVAAGYGALSYTLTPAALPPGLIYTLLTDLTALGGIICGTQTEAQTATACPLTVRNAAGEGGVYTHLRSSTSLHR